MNHDDYTRPDLPAVRSATSVDATSSSPPSSTAAITTQVLMLLCFVMMLASIAGGVIGNAALFEYGLVAVLALAGAALLTSIVTIASM